MVPRHLRQLHRAASLAVGVVVPGLIASVSHPGTFTILFRVDCVTFLAYALVLLRVRTPALHPDRARGSWAAVARAPLLLWPTAAGINLLCAGWALALERRLPEHVRLTPRGVEPEGFGAGAAG